MMDRKFFDINSPTRVSTSANSRPIIVGHHPIMADPMMRPMTNHRLATPLSPTAPAPVTQAPLPTHVAKVIAVSEDMKSDIAVAQSGDRPAMPQPPAVEPMAPVPESTPEPPLQNPEPALGGDTPTAAESSQAQPAPATISQPAPTPQQDLSHLPHMPIAHTHHKTGRLKSGVLWALIGLFLLFFGAYLAIDAGLAGSSVKLPVHIFHQDS